MPFQTGSTLTDSSMFQAKEWKGKATYFEMLMMRLLSWWFLSQLHLGILSHPVDLFPRKKRQQRKGVMKLREGDILHLLWQEVWFLWELGAWTQSPDLRDTAFKCGNYCSVCSNRIIENQLKKVLRGQLCSGLSNWWCFHSDINPSLALPFKMAGGIQLGYIPYPRKATALEKCLRNTSPQEK